MNTKNQFESMNDDDLSTVSGGGRRCGRVNVVTVGAPVVAGATMPAVSPYGYGAPYAAPYGAAPVAYPAPYAPTPYAAPYGSPYAGYGMPGMRLGTAI
jgi:hypothetical protein